MTDFPCRWVSPNTNWEAATLLVTFTYPRLSLQVLVEGKCQGMVHFDASDVADFAAAVLTATDIDHREERRWQ